MTTTDHALGHFEHMDLKSSLKLRLSTHFGVVLSSSITLPVTRSQSASNLAIFSDSHSWVSKGQQVSLSISLRIKDTRIGDQELEGFCNVVAKILAEADLWSQLGFECYIDSVATSALQKETVDIRLTLNPHHDLRRDTDHTCRANSIPEATVPPGVPTIRLNGITVDLCLSAWPFPFPSIGSTEPLCESSNPSLPSRHYKAHDESLPGFAIVITLLDASLQRLMFGHSVSRDVVEAKGAETSSLSQLAPSVFCPLFREGIALRASAASRIAWSLSRMNRRARSEELGEARVRKLNVDRLHHLGPAGKVQDHPASMQSITEVRLWYLMQDCPLDHRAHKSIKPLKLPDNLEELFPLKDEMLDDEGLEIMNWPGSTESQTVEDRYVSSEATMEEMMDDAAGEDLVPRFDCLDDEPSSEMMTDDDLGPSFDRLDDEPSSEKVSDDDLIPSFDRLDDQPSSELMLDDDLVPSFDRLDDQPSSEMMLEDERFGEMMFDNELVESGALSSEGSFEDLMAMPDCDGLDAEPSNELMLDDELVEYGALSSEGSFEGLMAMRVHSRRTIPISNGITADPWWEIGETLVYEESHGSHALTSRAGLEEGPDEIFSVPTSENTLDSKFSTVDDEAFASSDALDDEKQVSPRRLELEDEDDLLDR